MPKSEYSSILTKDEIKQFEAFGKIDYDQNHLELFTDQIIEDLFKIKDLPDTNRGKANVIKEYLGQYGFVEIDLGTNIFVMANYKYPGVVFKIACDDNGIADNFNDDFLADYIPELVKEIALHPSGIVSVQERKVVFRFRNRFNMFLNNIMKIITRLQRKFVLVDINLRTIRNFGLDRDGSIVIVDASDVFFIPEDYDIFKCRTVVGRHKDGKPIYCGSRLHYSDDFSELVCDECKRTFNPTELKRGGKKKLEMCSIHPGLDQEAWNKLNDAVYEAREKAIRSSKEITLSDSSNRVVYDAAIDAAKAMKQVTVTATATVTEEVEIRKDTNPTVVREDVPEDQDESVSVEEAAETVQAKLNQRFREITPTDILVTVDDSDEDSPAIYLSTLADGDDLEKLISVKGPEIFLSVNGKNEFMKVVNSQTLALMIMSAREEMIEEGTWEELQDEE